MRYWDSSALVSLCVRQPATPGLRHLHAEDTDVVTWILSDLEIRSALHRLGREKQMTTHQVAIAMAAVDALWETLHVVSLVLPVKTRAKRLLGLHVLRAADALQLAAALASVYDDPQGHSFVCLDARLSEAARREGFTLLP